MLNISEKLAEERTLLAFIRTITIFNGLYILLLKETNNTLYPNLIYISVNILLIYRIQSTNNITHRDQTIILGYLIFISSLLLLYHKNFK